MQSEQRLKVQRQMTENGRLLLPFAIRSSACSPLFPPNACAKPHPLPLIWPRAVQPVTTRHIVAPLAGLGAGTASSTHSDEQRHGSGSDTNAKTLANSSLHTSCIGIAGQVRHRHSNNAIQVTALTPICTISVQYLWNSLVALTVHEYPRLGV